MSDHAFELFKIVLDKGLLAFLVLFVGFLLKKWQEDRTFLLKKQQEERASLLKQQEEDRIAVLQRHFVPRVQFELQCDFFGPQTGEYLVCISIRVSNKGTTRRKFKNILLRLRGIEAGSALEYRDPAKPGSLEFPKLLMKTDLVPPSSEDRQNYYYVEPEVSQVFTYVTKIPVNIRYVLAHAKFIPITEEQEQETENEFPEERLFPVRSSDLGA